MMWYDVIWLYDVAGRQVISNGGFYAENISSLLDFYLQPLSQKVKSYIKDTNHFLRKIKESGQLPEGTILYNIDVVCLYPSVPHDEGLAFPKDFLGVGFTNRHFDRFSWTCMKE